MVWDISQICCNTSPLMHFVIQTPRLSLNTIILICVVFCRQRLQGMQFSRKYQRPDRRTQHEFCWEWMRLVYLHTLAPCVAKCQYFLKLVIILTNIGFLMISFYTQYYYMHTIQAIYNHTHSFFCIPFEFNISYFILLNIYLLITWLLVIMFVRILRINYRV